MKILAVDDEKLICWVLKQSIEKRLAYSVDYAYSGIEALQRIKERDYDAMITDLNMPGIKGTELIEKIREMEINMPVIVISAYLNINTLDSLAKCGVFRCISKPFQVDDVITAVSEITNDTYPGKFITLE